MEIRRFVASKRSFQSKCINPDLNTQIKASYNLDYNLLIDIKNTWTVVTGMLGKPARFND
jgi:hypothetical protein